MKKRISSLTLITALTITAIFSALLIWSLISAFHRYNVKKSSEIRDFYITQQKVLIKNEVNRLTTKIEAAKADITADAVAKLKEKVLAAENFAEGISRSHQSGAMRQELEVLTSSFVWDNKSGYFFVMDSKGTILHHGADKTMVGQNIHNLKENMPDAVSFFDSVYKNGEMFGTYKYYKPGEKDKTYEKMVYAKYDRKLGLLFATGIYKDDLDKAIQQQVLNSIKDDRFGYKNYGYFWIIDTNYNVIFHIDPEIDKLNLADLRDEAGKYIFRDFVKLALKDGSGYSEYIWHIPGSKEPAHKISYLVYLPGWNWIIGTGFYFENFENLLKAEQAVSNKILSDSLRTNGSIVFVLFIVIGLISLIIYRRIRKMEDSEEEYMNELIQLKTAMDDSTLVSITDTKGIIQYVNDQLVNLTGYSRERLLGSRHNILRHPDNPQSTYSELWDTIKSGKTWRGIIKNMKADGGYYFQRTSIFPFKDVTGKTVKYIALCNDVTEIFENRTKLQKYMNVDQITGLGNRASLMQSIRDSYAANLLLIDIDGFHRINESFGMQAGDMLLHDFSLRLSDNRQLKNYEMFRLHSDVFAVFSDNSHQDEFVKNTLEAIGSITDKTFRILGKDIFLRARTGYAHGSSDIMAQADSALQFAKANNINHYAFNQQLTGGADIYEKNSNIARMLQEALDDDRVIPFFQPVVGSISKQIKYECLMRVRGKNGEIIPPAEFLDISKQTRLYPKLTRAVAKKSIDTFKNIDTDFSINISSEDLLNTETMDFIYDYALENRVMHRMILEIVETESITGSAAATEAIYKFKLAGVKIAIDDFGSGYSNFDYLLRIKADIVKIDGSIVKLITKDERARDIFVSIVKYASKMNMKTVAEFISDQQLMDEAVRLGADFLQGYHLGKPSERLIEARQKAI